MSTLALDIQADLRGDVMVEPEPSDDALVTHARAGDVAAFERIYRRHAGRVHAICLRMSGSAMLAEELTQEVFIRAWQALGSFRGEAALGTWLHRVAVNVVLGERRSSTRREARESIAPAATAEPRTPNESPSGLRLDLEQAIAALPPGARAVFVLHDIEGYRHDEIAELTGIAQGTSKAQLHRARTLLREALK